ncbi:hypothetical protein PCASD_21282 [Puccinia coronata f. sp. avenae]|uniref:Uncharacterized protein n=1 Tax=Puccinia coronata f. sp. avenae TaxID=200324 RepID=A0A2N5TX17_9BASI|nr:hypothetical protein PCASD_21282 [Puccinia coronata f. sp. avenae]
MYLTLKWPLSLPKSFEGGQLKGEMTAYTGTLPAWPHLRWPTRNGRFGENKAQKRSKSQSPHATTGT